jgi:uncharacterized protein (DUF1499 family)
MNPPRTLADLRELIARGNGSNIAVTSDQATDPRLKIRLHPGPPDQGRAAVLAAARTLPRWRVADSTAEILWLTRTTRVFRFVDDIYVGFEPREGGTAILARSASRVGQGDLGQNRRNLAELWGAMR